VKQNVAVIGVLVAVLGLLLTLMGLAWQGSAKLTRLEVAIEELNKTNAEQSDWIERLVAYAMVR
jgi:hypothetical protein